MGKVERGGPAGEATAIEAQMNRIVDLLLKCGSQAEAIKKRLVGEGPRPEIEKSGPGILGQFEYVINQIDALSAQLGEIGKII